MKKSYLSILIVFLVSFLIFTGCEESGGDDVTEAISLGGTLTLEGTITKYFDSDPGGGDPPAWEDGVDDAADPYNLVDSPDGGTTWNEVVPDSDGNPNDDAFILTTDAPAPGDMDTVEDWGFVSDPSGVKVYSAEVHDFDDEQITEFKLGSEYADWYVYVYAEKAVIISGTAVDTNKNQTHIFDNVSLSQGWNKVISRTTDGETYTYTGGTISGAAWTFMAN